MCVCVQVPPRPFYKDASHWIRLTLVTSSWASQVVLVVKSPPANSGDLRDEGLIPGPERCPGEGNGNPLQYSCLENPMDGGAWWATVHGGHKESDKTEVT